MKPSCAVWPHHVERFWSRVQESEGCWEWVSTRNRQGYGQFSAGRFLSAHRFSWALHNGDIPKGMWVLHHCDNPSCVRPDHLWLGTHMDNVRDAKAKGRYLRARRAA